LIDNHIFLGLSHLPKFFLCLAVGGFEDILEFYYGISIVLFFVGLPVDGMVGAALEYWVVLIEFL